MTEPAVLVERDGHVLTVTLNRPDKRNAFNAEVLCRLCDAWDIVDDDPEIRAAILTGAGGNFSAGADLDRLVGAMIAGKPAQDEFEERIRNVPEANREPVRCRTSTIGRAGSSSAARSAGSMSTQAPAAPRPSAPAHGNITASGLSGRCLRSRSLATASALNASQSRW